MVQRSYHYNRAVQRALVFVLVVFIGGLVICGWLLFEALAQNRAVEVVLVLMAVVAVIAARTCKLGRALERSSSDYVNVGDDGIQWVSPRSGSSSHASWNSIRGSRNHIAGFDPFLELKSDAGRSIRVPLSLEDIDELLSLIASKTSHLAAEARGPVVFSPRYRPPILVVCLAGSCLALGIAATPGVGKRHFVTGVFLGVGFAMASVFAFGLLLGARRVEVTETGIRIVKWLRTLSWPFSEIEAVRFRLTPTQIKIPFVQVQLADGSRRSVPAGGGDPLVLFHAIESARERWQSGLDRASSRQERAHGERTSAG